MRERIIKDSRRIRDKEDDKKSENEEDKNMAIRLIKRKYGRTRREYEGDEEMW